MDPLPGGFVVKKLPIKDMPATNVVRKGLIYTYYYKNSNKCQRYNDLKKIKIQKNKQILLFYCFNLFVTCCF